MFTQFSFKEQYVTFIYNTETYERDILFLPIIIIFRLRQGWVGGTRKTSTSGCSTDPWPVRFNTKHGEFPWRVGGCFLSGMGLVYIELIQMRHLNNI